MSLDQDRQQLMYGTLEYLYNPQEARPPTRLTEDVMGHLTQFLDWDTLVLISREYPEFRAVIDRVTLERQRQRRREERLRREEERRDRRRERRQEMYDSDDEDWPDTDDSELDDLEDEDDDSDMED